MERKEYDLTTARNKEIFHIERFRSVYVGDYDGDGNDYISFEGMDDFYPDEFTKITDIRNKNFLYVTNSAQAGKKLILYFEEKRRKILGWI